MRKSVEKRKVVEKAKWLAVEIMLSMALLWQGIYLLMYYEKNIIVYTICFATALFVIDTIIHAKEFVDAYKKL